MSADIRQQLIALNTQVVEYYGDGRYREAVAISTNACNLARQHLEKNDPELALTLSNLAGVYESLSEYTEAEPLYQEAIAILREDPKEQAIQLANNLNSLAYLYYSMGNYDAAEPLYREALAILQTVQEEQVQQLIAVCLNNLGLLYQALSNYPTAQSFLQQALTIRRELLGEDHPLVARSLSNLGVLYLAMEEFAQAESSLRQALAIQRKVLGERHPEVANTLNSLAALQRGQGNYAEAALLYQEAITLGTATLGENHPTTASYVNNLARLYKAQGNYAEAEPLYQKALAVRRQRLGEDHLDVAGSLYNLASLYVATGRAIEALALMQQGAAIHDRAIGQLFSIGSESQRIVYLAKLQMYFDALLSLIVNRLSHSPEALRAGLDMVLRRKAIGVEALAAQRDAILGGRYPALEPKLRELTALRTRIAQKTLAGPGPEGSAAHQRQLRELNTQKEQLEVELAHHVPEITLARQLRTADRQAVAHALPRETALVEFVRFDTFDFDAIAARGERHWKEPFYIAFVLVAGDSDRVQLVNLGEAVPIDEQIALFRATMSGEAERHLAPASAQAPVVRSSQEAARLYVALFAPLVRALHGCKQLFLAPDGDITRLPFEVLPTDADHFLIDEYALSYLGSGRDLLRFGAKTSGQPSPPVVFADPDFDLSIEEASPQTPPAIIQVADARTSRDLNRGTLHFGRLPGTQTEGEKIAEQLNVQPWLAKAAVEARLKTGRSPHILHIATHGFFLPDQKELSGDEALPEASDGRFERLLKQRLENPLLRSGLALAGVNTWSRGGFLPAEAEDGLLTAEDVTGLDLLDTELVVLSACETGLGEVRIGEGVFGLRRAFVLAGARRLVMSLWKVPDQHTQELMVAFYRDLLEGRAVPEALRLAQRAMRDRYRHPYYWGAFIYQGDPRALS